MKNFIKFEKKTLVKIAENTMWSMGMLCIAALFTLWLAGFMDIRLLVSWCVFIVACLAVAAFSNALIWFGLHGLRRQREARDEGQK